MKPERLAFGDVLTLDSHAEQPFLAFSRLNANILVVRTIEDYTRQCERVTDPLEVCVSGIVRCIGHMPKERVRAGMVTHWDSLGVTLHAENKHLVRALTREARQTFS